MFDQMKQEHSFYIIILFATFPYIITMNILDSKDSNCDA